jgi:signal transduction histidine kinase
MIDELKVFFTINDVIVQFVHGQVFFLLGIIMGVEWLLQRSRLELARALPWLAAFGVLEAIATWGNVFIPLQERLASPDVIQNLRFLQLIVYLLTFATLLGFGLRLNEPNVPPWVAVYVPLVIVLVATTILATARALTSGLDVVGNNTGEALLRYALCFPAGMLVAYGLRVQAGRLVGPLKNARLIRVLRVAGFGFVFYAIFEGLIVPPAPFFLANVVNTDLVFNLTGIPIDIYRSIAGAVITLFLVLSLDAFRIEADRLHETLQRQQSLITERERISRDLHDGTIQSIYAVGLMVDDARHSLTQVESEHAGGNGAAKPVEQARVTLDSAMGVLNKTNEEIRAYIYDLRRSMAGDEDLARGLLDIVAEFRLRTTTPVDWNVEGCGNIKLLPEQRQHVYQIVREALNNVAKHASATRATVELKYDDCDEDVAQLVKVQVSDNGKGAAHPLARPGRGLLNMRERAELLNADIDVSSTPGKGTTVTLVVKA